MPFRQSRSRRKPPVPFAPLLGWVLLLCSAVVARASERPPNFIFILSDDLAQDDLGSYGQELIQTPRLDQMAAEGTRYLQAYCGTAVCAPSRASFFTGLDTGHCPIRGNYEVAPEGQLPLPAETVTIAEVAKAAGYATATFGKWGMGFFDTSGNPLKQGVDHFYGYNCQRLAHSYFPTYLHDDDQPFLLPGNDGQGVGETYAQELIQNEMIRWLKTHADKPFFLFYAVTLPHGRWEIDDLGIYSDKPWSEKEKTFAAMVTRLDSDVGELLDTLKQLGIDKNTLVVLSGDNGSATAPDGDLATRFKQTRNGLRGYKGMLYEGALRQAAIAWWPGTVPAGRVDDQPWAFWDLMPTFVEMSGATPPAGYETNGLSLVDYLKGGEAPQRDSFYWELNGQQALRFGQWKAVRNAITRPIEIYNLKNDPGESMDLAAERPDLVEKAQEILIQSRREDPNWPLGKRSPEHAKSAREAWKIKRLRDANQWVPGNARPPGEP